MYGNAEITSFPCVYQMDVALRCEDENAVNLCEDENAVNLCEDENALNLSDDDDTDDGQSTSKNCSEATMPISVKNTCTLADAKGGGGYVYARVHMWDMLQKGLDELSEKDVLALTFNSDDEAGLFYDTYAKVIGFSVRKMEVSRNRNRTVVGRLWVCSREGQRKAKWSNQSDRKRAPRPISRVGCLACFRIRLDRNTGRYVVASFIKDHNHDLASPKEVPFLRVNKRKAEEDVGFTKKDIRNAWARSDIQYGDAWDVLIHCGLSYLCARAEYDQGLYYKYDVNEENQLCRLFWADSKSIADYAFFGDVLVINTKYRINAYGKPFIMLSGVNNHHQMVVFGCALLGDETNGTYTWVLEKFLEAVGLKKPVSVVTDSNGEIEEAIKKTFPTSHHRICRWHLNQDVAANVTDASFRTDFKTCMEENCSTQEFEVSWAKLVERCGLQDNPWLTEIYSKRTKWAECYLREYFFAGMSTIRSKGMNVYFDRFLNVRLNLHEFMMYYDKALFCLRQNEAKADTESEQAYPTFSTALRDLERHAAEIFTRGIFYKLRDEILNDATLILTAKEYLTDVCCWTYEFSEYMKPETKWKVRFDPADKSFQCSCFKLVTEGVPCCHMISVMKHEHLREIPISCIKSRWTKQARNALESSMDSQSLNRATQTARFGILSSMSTELNYLASQTTQGFKEARDAICKLTSRIRQINALNGEVGETLTGASDAAGSLCLQSGLCDPTLAKDQGQT